MTAVTPMLASPGRPPEGDLDNWAAEFKWDGMRALAHVSRGELRLTSRTGKDVTARFPELAPGAGTGEFLLDGEITAMRNGRPDFEALQSRMHVTSPAEALRLSKVTPVTYLAFDILGRNGVTLLAMPYSGRRRILESCPVPGIRWSYPHSFPGANLGAVIAASAAEGIEGVVAKRLDSRYEPGVRSRSWLKMKNTLSQDVVIGGWTPGTGSRFRTIGTLVTGVYENGRLAYCGHVGTGFSQAALQMLSRKLGSLLQAGCPFSGPVIPAAANWVRPVLVAEVQLAGWTGGGIMREPVYRGLRGDKDPESAVREP